MSTESRKSTPAPPCDEALLAAYRDGDQTAAEMLFQRYYARLVSLARSQMGYTLRQLEESSDVAMSVFESVFQRGRENRIYLDPNKNLWPLLVKITINKIRNHAKTGTRIKRDQRRTVPILDSELLEADAVPTHAMETKELILQLHDTFGPRRRVVIDGLLEGLSVAQIAEKTGLAERTVYKTRQGIKEILERMAADGNA